MVRGVVLCVLDLFFSSAMVALLHLHTPSRAANTALVTALRAADGLRPPPKAYVPAAGAPQANPRRRRSTLFAAGAPRYMPQAPHAICRRRLALFAKGAPRYLPRRAPRYFGLAHTMTLLRDLALLLVPRESRRRRTRKSLAWPILLADQTGTTGRLNFPAHFSATLFSVQGPRVAAGGWLPARP